MEAVLRVSEAKVNGGEYHRLLIPKNLSVMLGLKKNDVVHLDLLRIKRDGTVVWPRESSDQGPVSTASDDELEREIEAHGR